MGGREGGGKTLLNGRMRGSHVVTDKKPHKNKSDNIELVSQVASVTVSDSSHHSRANIKYSDGISCRRFRRLEEQHSFFLTLAAPSAVCASPLCRFGLLYLWMESECELWGCWSS